MGKGSCLCEKVKYTFTNPPAMQAICHCLACRKISGTAYTTNLIVPAPNFSIVAGNSNLQSYSTIHESGMTLTFHFCKTCGTKIYKEADADNFKGVVLVVAGTLSEGEGEGEMGIKDVKVGAEFYIKHRVGWLESLEGAGQCQEFA